MVVTGAGFLDVRFDQITVLSDIASADIEAVENFDTLGVGLAELQHAQLVRVTHLFEDDVEISEALQSRLGDCKRYLRLTDGDAARDELSRPKDTRGVIENAAGTNALARRSKSRTYRSM